MNEWKRIDIPIKELPSGDVCTVAFFILKGGSGPHVYIQSGIHGAEIQGNGILYHLLSYLIEHPFRGTCTLVPLANPMGANLKLGGHTFGRIHPTTGENWNRNYEAFPQDSRDRDKVEAFVREFLQAPWEEVKEAYKGRIHRCFQDRAQETGTLDENKKMNLILQSYACGADIVLDLHTSPVGTHYLYAPDYGAQRAQAFHFPFTLLIPPRFAGAMDESCFVPWVELKKAFARQGREVPLDIESYTLEVGSDECLDWEQAREDAYRILHYLATQGVIDDDKLPPIKKPPQQFYGHLKYVRTYYAPRGGLISYRKAPGEKIQKGEVLGTFLNFKSLTAEGGGLTDVRAQEEGWILNHAASCSMGQGEEIYQVMERAQMFTSCESQVK